MKIEEKESIGIDQYIQLDLFEVNSSYYPFQIYYL